MSEALAMSRAERTESLLVEEAKDEADGAFKTRIAALAMSRAKRGRVGGKTKDEGDGAFRKGQFP